MRKQSITHQQQRLVARETVARPSIIGASASVGRYSSGQSSSGRGKKMTSQRSIGRKTDGQSWLSSPSFRRTENIRLSYSAATVCHLDETCRPPFPRGHAMRAWLPRPSRHNQTLRPPNSPNTNHHINDKFCIRNHDSTQYRPACFT